LLPCGSGYFTRIHNMKLVTTKFKSRGLHEKHVVATWKLGNHRSGGEEKVPFPGNEMHSLSPWILLQ